MRTMLVSISPQAKAHTANVITTSLGVSTALAYIPAVLGSIATLAAIIASIVLTRRALKQTRMDAEMHELKMKLMTKELESHAGN